MPKRPDFDTLTFIPSVIANTVCDEVYTGQEFRQHGLQSAALVTETEALRQRMTDGQKQEFADLCDTRCRVAYRAKAKWMNQIARYKSNLGRDLLYMWTRHWLSAYLRNPELLRRDEPVT